VTQPKNKFQSVRADQVLVDADSVLALYREVLATDVGLDDDFYGAGGHSLLAVLLADRIRDQFRIAVTGLEVVDRRTPRGLVELLRRVAAGPAGNPAASEGGTGGATVLVTGASGGVGSFVVTELVARGYRVRAMVRPESAQLVDPAAEIVVVDLSRPDDLRAAVGEADSVIHVACSWTRSDVDVAAMSALADGWRDGAFVYVSSIDAYGTPSEPDVVEGQAPTGELSDYGQGKVDCENILLDLAERRGALDRVSIVRLPLIWGAHDRFRDQLRHGALSPLYRRATGNEPILVPEVPDGGWFGTPWVGADAVARALVTAVDRPTGRVVNAIGGHVGWPEYAAELVRLTRSDSPVIESPEAWAALRRPWRYSGDLLAAWLGYPLAGDWWSLLADVVAAKDTDPAMAAGSVSRAGGRSR
jgi:nucleoside-diphosphate-sugar epimerase